MSYGVFSTSLTLFLFFYYNQVLGLSGSLTGTALFLGLVIDAFSDPLMGAISDRTRSRFGRRHPYLFVSAIPLGVLTVCLFAPPQALSDWNLFLWLAGFTIASRLAITLYLVPHMALGAELTSDYKDRNNIVAVRQFFAETGGLFAMVIGFGYFFVDSKAYSNGQYNPDAYLPYSIAAGAIMTSAILVSAFSTMSRIPYLVEPTESPKLSPLQFVRESFGVLSNRNFRTYFYGVLGFYVLLGAQYTMILHMNIHFWKFDSRQNFIFMTAISIVNTLSVMAWAYITQFLKRNPCFS